MPTYEYVCTECDSPLEVVQSIHEPSLTECPQCQGRLRKVFGNVGVVFKGSGFYRTDSRAKSSGKTASPASGSGTEKKSDTPAAEKAPATAPKTSEKSTSAPATTGGGVTKSTTGTVAKSA